MSGSSAFPMRLEKTHMKHRGGTKFYQVVYVENALGAGLAIDRFGKVNAVGSINPYFFPRSVEARSNYEKKLREKDNRGYVPETPIKRDVNTLSELQSLIGPNVYAKIPAEIIENFVPGATTAGLKHDRDEVDQLIEELTGPPEPSQEERIAVDDMWGIL